MVILGFPVSKAGSKDLGAGGSFGRMVTLAVPLRTSLRNKGVALHLLTSAVGPPGMASVAKSFPVQGHTHF